MTSPPAVTENSGAALGVGLGEGVGEVSVAGDETEAAVAEVEAAGVAATDALPVGSPPAAVSPPPKGPQAVAAATPRAAATMRAGR